MVSYSVAIQAGGKSSRMGEDKGLLKFGDQALVKFILNQVKGLAEEAFIVSNNKNEYLEFGLPVYSDIYKDIGALGGIHTILNFTQSDYVLILACDMPFVNLPLVKYMMSFTPDFDVIVPQLEDAFVEPFKAFYSKSCLPAVNSAIKRGQKRVISFFEDVNVKVVGPEKVRMFDPEFKSFLNVNTPNDYQEALILAGLNS